MKSLILSFVLVVGLILPCLASDSQTINVTASIPTMNPEFDITISKVQGATWTEKSSIDFGQLSLDSENNIWVADAYYAVDVGVSANTDWVITHEAGSISGPGGTLDDNVNVTFVKQITSTSDSELAKVTYGGSNGRTYSKSELSGGWLRIYYGIATGDASADAPGAEPITDMASGSYNGSVVLTVVRP